jgi:2-phospho-L-lactate guanylyltransferase
VRVRALIPQKALLRAKGRLGSVLPEEERAALSLALLKSICGVLRATVGVEDVVVMTPDPAVRDYAAACGVRGIFDPQPGLNDALAGALRVLSSADRGLLVVAGDLPLLQPADVAAVLASGGAGTLVLAPSRDEAGTNALLVPPGVAVRPVYGIGSRRAHHSLARRRGFRVIEVRRPGLAFDLDTPADLAALGGWWASARPWAV